MKTIMILIIKRFIVFFLLDVLKTDAGYRLQGLQKQELYK